MTDQDRPLTGDEKLSQELGVDVDFLTQQVRFRLDLARMAAGKTGELAYLLIERDHHEDVAIVYDNLAQAEQAMIEDPLVDDLCAEDCLDARIEDRASFEDLLDREILLP